MFHSLVGRSCCFAQIQGGSRFGIGTPYRSGCGMFTQGYEISGLANAVERARCPGIPYSGKRIFPLV